MIQKLLDKQGGVIKSGGSLVFKQLFKISIEMYNFDIFLGTSDPYVKFKIGGRLMHKTKTIYKDLNPLWDEVFTVPIDDAFQPVQMKVRKPRLGREITLYQAVFSHVIHYTITNGRQSFSYEIPKLKI